MGLKATATTVDAPKGKGLLKQVTEVFPNIVTGVAKLAGHAAYTPIGIARAVGDMGSGKLPSQQTGGSFLSRLKLNLHKYTPFAEDVIGIGESIPKTVGNVGQFTASLAPGGIAPSQTEYGKANREGRIVNTVIGDVANLSLLAGAGAKAASMAGAEGAAARLATVAKLGDQAGMAPAKIWTEPLRLAGKIPVKGGTLAEAAKAATEGVLGRTPGTALWGTEAGRALKSDIIEGRQQIAEHGSLPVADIAKPAIKAGVSVPESQAAGLVLQGEAPVLAKIAETGKLAEFVKARYPELDPQAAELAVKYHAGQLDEATSGRIDVARETYQALSDRQTGLAREGVGSPVKLSEEQLGNKPLSTVAEDYRFKLEKKRDKAGKLADVASTRASRARIEADARTAFAKALPDIERPDTAFRRGISAGRKVQQATEAARKASGLQSELGRLLDEVASKDQNSAALSDLYARIEAKTQALTDAQSHAETMAGRAGTLRGFARVTGDLRKTFTYQKDAAGEFITNDKGVRVRDTRFEAEKRPLSNNELRRQGRADERVAQANDAARTAERELARAQAQFEEAAKRYGERGAATPEVEQAIARERQLVDRAQQAFSKAQENADRLRQQADVTVGIGPKPAEVSLARQRSEFQRVGKAEQKAANLEARANRLVRSREYYNDQIAGLPAKLDSVIEAAPARFRPAMRTASEGVKFLTEEASKLDEQSPGAGDSLRSLAEDMPTSLSQLTAAGVDPTHIIGGLAPGSVAGGGSLAVKTRKLTQQFVRQGGESDLSLPGVVKKYEADSVRRYQNLVAENIAKVHAVSPTDLGVSSSLVGPELAAQMEALGYKPFATNRLGASVPAEQVTQSTRFMAAPLHDAFANWFKTTPDNAFVQGSTWLNRKWKNTVLPLSPRWHIGNIVGNAFLGTLGAGVDTISLLKAVREAKAGRSWREWMAQDGEVAGTPNRLYATGLQHGDYAALFKGEVKEPPKTILGRTINKSYRFNEFVDNVGRSAVYLNKLEQAGRMGPQLSKAGLSAEEFALRESLKAMGDFSRMTPFEQSYVKNVIPFYAWMRHMTALSVKLPLEHPLRVAWTINLADRFGDQGDLPDYIRGNLKVGGTFLPTRALSPFSDVGGGALLNPASAARGVSPFIKLPVAAATGINLSRGFNQTSRPAGTGNLDSLGRETFTPLINRPRELANVALGQVPVARNLRDLIRGAAPRYDTGQRIKGLERQSGAGRVYKPLLDILNVPRPLDTSQDQIERTLAAAAKRRAANAKLKK